MGGGGAEWRRLFTGGASGGGLLAEAVSCVHIYRMSRCLWGAAHRARAVSS